MPLYADYVQGIKLSTGYKKYVTSDASIKPKNNYHPSNGWFSQGL